MSLPPPPAACDPVTSEGPRGPVTPKPWASGPLSQAQPLLSQEAKEEEEEEGEETGVQGAWGTGTAEQRRRGWGEAAEAAAADEGQAEAGDAAAAGSGSPAGGAGGGSGGWPWRQPPQCCPCAAPLPRFAAHCCHGGTKMAALAYNLGKREINHYFSVRSAKVLALVAVLLLAAGHLASRRYRGERALPLPEAGRGGRRRRGCGRPPPAPNTAHARAASSPPARRPSGEVLPPCPPAAPGRPAVPTPGRAASAGAWLAGSCCCCCCCVSRAPGEAPGPGPPAREGAALGTCGQVTLPKGPLRPARRGVADCFS